MRSGICRRTSMRSWSSASSGLVGVMRAAGRSRRRSAARSSRCWRSSSPASRHRAAASPRPVRRRAAGVLRVPGRRAWSAAGVDRPLPPHLAVFEAYLARIGVTALGALAGAPQRVRRRARRRRPGKDDAARQLRGAAGVPALRAPRRRPRQRPERRGRVAAGLPAVDVPRSISWDEVGAGARRRRSPHAGGQARLRDPAAAGHLRPARPRDRGADARRHRLEARAAGGPGAQGRPLDGVPAVGAWSARRSSTTCGTVARQTADRHVFFRAVAPVQPIGAAAVSLAAPATTCSRPGSRCPGPARTRCATPACSGWSTPTSR